MALPNLFCWTRFGTEAGQSVQSILARKEEERQANGGVFLWGIGNAIGPSLRRLLELVETPRVFFSPISSPPRRDDCSPPSVVAWSSASTLDGRSYSIPESCLVTSRWDPNAPKGSHYALVCKSDESLLRLRSHGAIAFSSLRNLVSGQSIGSSQVTAVVRRDDAVSEGREYDLMIAAELVAPYLVTLTEPIVIDCSPGAVWEDVVTAVWTERRRRAIAAPQKLPW